MIWIPALSILFFVIAFAWSIFVGVRNGWRASLFISILLLAFTGLFIGIAAGIYDSVLWPLYRDRMLASKIQNGVDLDLNTFSDTYKKVILLEVGGLLFPLSVLFTWIIYHFTKIPLNKYLGHEMKKEKSDNLHKATIILRKDKSRVYSKIGGAVILGSTGLISASFAASAMNAFTTPYEKSNGMNKFNDTLAIAYGFGQTRNNESAQVISEFLSTIDINLVIGITNLTNFNFNENDVLQIDANKLSELVSRKNLFAEIFKNTEASTKIFKSILKINSGEKINPLWLNSNVVANDKDADNNQIGFHDTKRKIFIKEIEDNLAKTKQNLDFLPKSVRQVIFDSIVEKISNYSSFASRNLIAVNTLSAKYKGELEKRNNEKTASVSGSRKIADELVVAIKGFEDMVGRKFQIPTDYDIGKKALRDEYQKLVVNDVANIKTWQGGTIGKLLEDKQKFEAKLKTDKDSYNKKNQDFLNYKKSSFDPANINYRKAKTDFEEAGRQLTLANKYIKETNDKINNENKNIDSFTSKIKNFNDEKSKSENLIKEYKQKIDDETQELNVKKANLANAQQKNPINNNDVSRFSTDIRTLNDDINLLKSKLSTEKANLQNITKNIRSQEDQRQIATTNITTLTSDLASAETDKHKKELDYKSAMTNRDAKLAAYNTALKQNNAKQKLVDEAKALVGADQKNVDSETKEWQGLIKKFNERNTEINELKGKLHHLENDYDKLIQSSSISPSPDSKQAYGTYGSIIDKLNNDNGSIEYMEAINKFIGQKVIQLDSIEKNTHKIYEDSKKQFKKDIKDWLSL